MQLLSLSLLLLPLSAQESALGLSRDESPDIQSNLDHVALAVTTGSDD